MIPPCKDCTKREVGCHSKCKAYHDWKADWDKYKVKEKAERDLDRRLRFSTVNRRMRRK